MDLENISTAGNIKYSGYGTPGYGLGEHQHSRYGFHSKTNKKANFLETSDLDSQISKSY